MWINFKTNWKKYFYACLMCKQSIFACAWLGGIWLFIWKVLGFFNLHSWHAQTIFTQALHYMLLTSIWQLRFLGQVPPDVSESSTVCYFLLQIFVFIQWKKNYHCHLQSSCSICLSVKILGFIFSAKKFNTCQNSVNGQLSYNLCKLPSYCMIEGVALKRYFLCYLPPLLL